MTLFWIGLICGAVLGVIGFAVLMFFYNRQG